MFRHLIKEGPGERTQLFDYDYSPVQDVDYLSIPHNIPFANGPTVTIPTVTSSISLTTSSVLPSSSTTGRRKKILLSTTEAPAASSTYPPACLQLGNPLLPKSLLACLTALAMGQTHSAIQAQMANQIDRAISETHESSGFHFFEINGSAALGHGMAILFVAALLTLVACCYLRCRRAALKHFSLRNMMPAWPSPRLPFSCGPCGRASAPVLPISVPASQLSMPISPASAPIILHQSSATAPPAYEMTPLQNSKIYASDNSGVPYGV